MRRAIDDIIERYFNSKIAFLLLLLFLLALFSNNFVPDFAVSRGYNLTLINLFIGFAVIVYFVSFGIIRYLSIKNSPSSLILKINYWHFFSMYYSTAVFIPLFSNNFITADWWVVIIACVVLQSLPEIRLKEEIIINAAPTVSLCLHILKKFLINGIFEISLAECTFVLYLTMGLLLVKFITFGFTPSPGKSAESEDFLNYFSKKYSLTGRETDILLYLSGNLSRNEIAGKLFISSETVKKHSQNIYQKLNIKKRIDLYILFNDEKLKFNNPEGKDSK
jgi:DNA-binding CsgD family transcriptional regulator